MSAVNMARADWRDVDPKNWTPAHTKLIKAAASEPRVERIFVNPALKVALCREAGRDRDMAGQGQADLGPQLPFPHPA